MQDDSSMTFFAALMASGPEKDGADTSQDDLVGHFAGLFECTVICAHFLSQA